MRFAADVFLSIVLIVCASGGAGAARAAGASGPSESPPGAAITADEIRVAAAKLAADPSLGRERKIRTLRWTHARPPEAPSRPPAWILGLFEYLAQTGSVLLWAAGIIAAGISGAWVYRTLRARTPAPKAMPIPRASRVGELDIRPESLPDDIGTAALGLAEAGKTRDALSLLYRGALSRAVNVFGVPIGESFTEGEALRAVGERLDAPRVSYFSELVGLRRRAVYAGRSVEDDPIRHLCQGFSAALDSAGP